MKNKINFLILSSFICLFSTLTKAQNIAAEGMEAKETNFSSFGESAIHNLDSWKRINQKEYYSHPEFGLLPSDAPCKECSEDLSKRTIDERFFVDNKDHNQYYQQKAMGQLHEFVDGKWITVDHRLKKSANGIYMSGFNLERAGFNLLKK